MQRQIGQQNSLILLNKNGPDVRVARVCFQAFADGVRQGMPYSLAKALCPKATYREWQPEQDVSALEHLALRMTKVCPFVGLESEILKARQQHNIKTIASLYYGLILDMSGTERLYHSEEFVSEKIISQFERLKIEAHLGIAASIGAAWALSRQKKKLLIIKAEQSLRAALSSLSIKSLRLSHERYALLTSMGLRSITDLEALPRKQIALRFGLELVRRLDQLYGTVEEPFISVQESRPLRVKKSFDVPLQSKNIIVFCLLKLLGVLFQDLAQRKRQAGVFQITLIGKTLLYEPFCINKTISLNSATQSFTHIQSVLTPLIEKIAFKGPVECIVLEAAHLEPAYATQGNYLESTDVQRLASESKEFLNVLSSRLGVEKVRILEPQSSHVPERSFTFKVLPQNFIERRTREVVPPIIQTQRPSKLLEKPEPITALAMLPDKAPVRVVWREKELRIIQSQGPERICGEWWNNSIQCERDYFRLQDSQGLWFWVFRDNQTEQWFIHGIWQ